jgi:hypothetical protein
MPHTAWIPADVHDRLHAVILLFGFPLGADTFCPSGQRISAAEAEWAETFDNDYGGNIATSFSIRFACTTRKFA